VSELPLGCKLSLEEINPHLVLVPVLAQALDLLLEKQVFLLGRRLAVLARWLPGLKKVPMPSIRSAGFLGVPKRQRALTLLMMHLKSAPPLGRAGGIAQSLRSRAMLADWPWTSQHSGWQPRRRGPSWCRCNMTGSSLHVLLLGWVPLVGQFPRLPCDQLGSPMPSLLLPHWQVSVFMPSCSCALVALHLAMCCSCQTLQADQPGFLFQALLPLLCPCLSAWAVPICLDWVVVAFLVAGWTTWWLLSHWSLFSY
jgi:hypothetical protein